jgi:hypothetical protein
MHCTTAHFEQIHHPNFLALITWHPHRNFTSPFDYFVLELFEIEDIDYRSAQRLFRGIHNQVKGIHLDVYIVKVSRMIML